MGEKIGNEGQILIGAAGTSRGTTLVPKVRDNELTLSAGEVDKTSRADAGWKNFKQGLKEWGASFDMIYDTAETSWAQLQTAYFNGAEIGCSIVDDTGGEGVHGKVIVTEFGRGEPLDGVMTTKITLKGCGAPAWGV